MQNVLNAADTQKFLEQLKDLNHRQKLLTKIAENPQLYHRETLLEQIAPHIEHYEQTCCLILEKLLQFDAPPIIAFLRDLAIMNYTFAMPCLLRFQKKYEAKLKADFEAAFQDIDFHENNRIALFPVLMGEK